ncbi:SUF system NifU family Fe-S cluster assembly protein [Nakamurella sp. YIM 132087]|uniref:SUF system NifU family Fe-S cluster assembly protein n=1 Tax=Nakamurella alba TaxID=2665158 RepID=A0A7K1FLL5_9ACTN|nr:SUF system NifU family Fe-S cluster assembly protein [Nakamurella alba]MTD13774.1 SUF system NifU family Fe-S cluster assembly protein [Nakamurella alba]
MKMEALYQEIILDHYRAPHHAGLREEFDSQVHHVNPTCGDEVTLRVKLSQAEGADTSAVVVEDISYDALGCSISQASTSVLTDLTIGRSLPEALATLDEFNRMVTSRGTVEGDEDVLGDGIAFAGVSKYPARVKCALLGWMAFKDAASQALDGAGGAQTEQAAPPAGEVTA